MRYLAFALVTAAIFVATAADAVAVTLSAGTAKVSITPPVEDGNILVMGVPPTGMSKEIFARALVLNDGSHRLVFITYDLNCLDVATPILRKRCRDELGIEASHLILLGTHNHCAPIQIVPRNFAYGRQLADKLFQLVETAIAAEQGPVRVEFGFGGGYFLRNTGNAPIDHEIQVLKVTAQQADDDRLIALLFNHPTHPIQIQQDIIDPGHPGYACDEIEAQHPGALALYSDAAGGNQFIADSRGLFGTEETVRRTAHQLAQAALDIAAGPLTDVTGPLASTLEVISLPLAEPLSYEEAQALAREKEVPLDIGLVAYPHKDRGTNWIRNLLRYHEQGLTFPTRTTDLVCTDDTYLVKELPEPREFPCVYEETIVATIGPLPVVAMQGEVCAPIGMRIKDAFRRDGPIMLFAYMGEHNLYIPTRELVRLDAYQAQVIRIQYACPVGWAPEVEDEMVDAVIEMVKQAIDD